ncbi:uncharacterized protein LOC110253253 isoform X2 [Exaiptasia diaphana]|uniref:Uncharacterized protein n=1 Tax=Exaiptasia diaphana TaxID=2652724 RepID=A0A913Y763_EXADI|nr:uncharacterized protein LOC110253253 isoform X2 [Exaiptasia diaphana]
MALNREMESIQTKDEESPTVEFSSYTWPQVGHKRTMDLDCDNGPSSPKQMIMEFANEEETGSPIVIHIGSGENLVVTGDNDSSIAEGKATVAYIENNHETRGPILEDNIIRKNSIECNDQPEEINGFPVYKLRRHAPFLNETLELCMGVNLNKELVCHQVPPNVQASAIFVVDFQCVRHHDVVARDKGCFGRQSSPTRHVALKIALDRTIEDIKTIKFMTEDMSPEPGFEFYKIRRHYTWHKFISGLSRIITRLEYKNELFRYGVVQFKLSDEDKSFASNFKPSVQATPEKSHSQRSSSKASIENTRTPRVLTAGTVSKSSSALNSQPSSSSQAKAQASSTASCKNEIFNILQNADKPRPQLSKVADYSKLLSLLKCDEFLCDVSFCSMLTDDTERVLNPRTFAMGELQRHWLQSFCTGANPKSIVSITNLHKLGNVYLTALTCSLPIFVLKDDPSKHPTVLLALMTSLTNEKQDYEYLASKLRQQGITQMVYGTDGVAPLDDVLEKNFPTTGADKSIHVCCFDNAKDIIMQKLDSMKVKTGDFKLLISRQILGFDMEDSGDALVDHRSDAKFREIWSNVEPAWPMAFREWIHKPQEGSERSFYDTLRRCMLRPVRVAAGLGDPPKKYSNRVDNRGINDAITELEQEAKQSVDLVKVHEIFKTRAVDSQITDFVKAMYNMGQLRLAKEYQHLTVSLLNVDK